MLKKLFFVFLFFPILLSISKCDTDQKEKRIAWSSKAKLSWDDFKGEPDKGDTVYDAKTFTTISFEPTVQETSIFITVICEFDSDLSWVKSKFKDDESLWLLEHEKLHFDIAELIARMIRKDFSEYKSYDLSNTNNHLHYIYDKHIDSTWLHINIDYDEETNHGKLINEQEEWEKFIDRELRKLNRYSDTVVKIRRMTVN